MHREKLDRTLWRWAQRNHCPEEGEPKGRWARGEPCMPWKELRCYFMVSKDTQGIQIWEWQDRICIWEPYCGGNIEKNWSRKFFCQEMSLKIFVRVFKDFTNFIMFSKFEVIFQLIPLFNNLFLIVSSTNSCSERHLTPYPLEKQN